MNIKIDPEFRDLIPPLSEVELKQLHDNLSNRGCLNPLIVWKEEGILLDGHNRHKFCNDSGYEYDVKELTFASRDQAKNWIIKNQLGRRNVSPDMAAKLRGMLYLSRKKEHGGDRKSEESSAQNEQLKTDTAELIAQQTGVSRATIVRDAAYAEACDKLGITTAAIASGKERRSRSEIIATARPDKSKPKRVVKTPYEKILTLLPRLTSKELQDLNHLIETKF